MDFKSKKINSKRIGIIDIGSYKIRVGICKIKNGEVDLAGYGEKRQNNQDIILGEFLDLKSICENISLAIEKAEQDAGFKINDIVINIPFDEVFIETDSINYKRKNKDEPITKEELQKIIKEIKRKSLNLSINKIKEKSYCEKEDVHLIMSNISKIEIDEKEEKDDLIGETGENIIISNLNIYITKSKYELVEYISDILNKNIFKIIPAEFSIAKLFKKEKNIVMIDFGAKYTSITIKKDGSVCGNSKLPIGMNDLIKKIQENNNKTKIEIINSIEDDSLFNNEKKEFLEVLEDFLYLGLENILGSTSICPNIFFLTGGGNSKFVRDFIKNIKIDTYKIRLTKDIEIIDIKIEKFNKIISKSNLNVISMMLTTLELIKKENNKLTIYIENAIKELILE